MGHNTEHISSGKTRLNRSAANLKSKNKTNNVAALIDKRKELPKSNFPEANYQFKKVDTNGINKVIQAETKIKHTTGHVKLDLKGDGKKTNHKVGKKMEAELDVKKPVIGSATGVNWTWMQHLRKTYIAANVIRGHLLNHDLGGFGVEENLYPISTKANSEHSIEVEQKVKKLLNEQDKGSTGKKVFYDVEVGETNSNNPKEATFKCKYYVQGQTPTFYNVKSNLGTDNQGYYKPGNVENPHPKWAHESRSGEEDFYNLANDTSDNRIKTSNEDSQGIIYEQNINAYKPKTKKQKAAAKKAAAKKKAKKAIKKKTGAKKTKKLTVKKAGSKNKANKTAKKTSGVKKAISNKKTKKVSKKIVGVKKTVSKKKTKKATKKTAGVKKTKK
ncbi:hypothetical protein [Reichenbachiella sp.]|uniref:hypothetical protein n=1 Tax=Reichenbachiella sp. TaxID=2184521 RepID=UPI003BAECDFB